MTSFFTTQPIEELLQEIESIKSESIANTTFKFCIVKCIAILEDDVRTQVKSVIEEDIKKCTALIESDLIRKNFKIKEVLDYIDDKSKISDLISKELKISKFCHIISIMKLIFKAHENEIDSSLSKPYEKNLEELFRSRHAICHFANREDFFNRDFYVEKITSFLKFFKSYNSFIHNALHSQTGMNINSFEDAEKVESTHIEVNTKLLKYLSSKEKIKFEASIKSFNEYRKSQIDFISSLWEGGSIRPLQVNSEYLSLTRDIIEYKVSLYNFLKSVRTEN